MDRTSTSQSGAPADRTTMMTMRVLRCDPLQQCVTSYRFSGNCMVAYHCIKVMVHWHVQGAALTAEDLTLISQLGQLIIQRPPNQTLCHQVHWQCQFAFQYSYNPAQSALIYSDGWAGLYYLLQGAGHEVPG